MNIKCYFGLFSDPTSSHMLSVSPTSTAPCSLCGPWPSQQDSTPNITANPTAADVGTGFQSLIEAGVCYLPPYLQG